MSKRLLIITQHFWPENFRINDMVEGFLTDGIVVDVLCGLPNYPHGEWFDGYTANGPFAEEYHGATVYRCREIRRKGNTSPRIFLNYISYPLSAALALHRLPGGYDAILCYNTSPVLMSFPAILAARKFKAPLTNYVLDIWPENLYSVLNIQNKALRRIASAVSDWHYRRADRLIAMNESLAARLRARVSTQNAKGCYQAEKAYAVIPQYCEDFYDYTLAPQESISAARQDTLASPLQEDPLATAKSQAAPTPQAAPDAAPFTIQFAGNFSPAQSLDTVIEAMALVHANIPSIHLHLIGDGMSRALLQKQVATLALGSCVHFFDSVCAAEIPALAAKADALLISLSASADLGLTVPAKFASCMAAGKPLLVAIDGEGARVATESGGALVCKAADPEALAQNIVTLYHTAAPTREAMGQAAYAYYQAHYNRTKLLQEIEAFLF